MDKKSVSSRIRALREAEGLSMQELSNKIGIPKRTIDNYERAITPPSFDFLNLLCTTFGANANWLLTGHGEMYVSSKAGEPVEASIQEPASEELDIYDLLKKAGEVLESPGIYRTALASNINAFHHSIKMSQDLADMKARMDTLEEFEAQTKIKFDELAQMIKGLQEENKILKQLRSSEEDPLIIGASSQTTRPSSRKTE